MISGRPAVQCIYAIFIDWTPLAARLTERLESRRDGPDSPLPVSSGRASRALSAACIIALAGMTLTGALRKMTTWPINCYPTFDWPISDDYDVRTLEAMDIDGNVRVWPLTYDPLMLKFFGNERWKAMVSHDFGSPDAARSRAAVQLWLANHPSPPLASAMITDTIYRRPEAGGAPVPLSTCVMETLTASELR